MIRIMTADGSTRITTDGTLSGEDVEPVQTCRMGELSKGKPDKIRAQHPVQKVLSMAHRCLALLTVLAALSWSGLAQDSKKNAKDDPDAIGNRHVGQGVNFYSLDKEIALGRRLAQEVERQGKVITDPVIAEYVNRVGQNIVRNSDAKVPFTIKVLDSEEVNAFALPGGFFFVNSGLILKADSEAELAGVMAHEIAHVALRHGTKQATRGDIAQIATIPLIFMGGWAGYGARQLASVLIPVGFLQFSQVMEKDADYYGLQ